ncbi:MAG: hypothetical protein HOC27_01965 [Phycisphaerae bacterium]|nr:hypothetical protein [Phycisphaerae bacterium]
MSTKFNCTTTALSAVLIASFVGTTTSILHAEGIKPDATLLRFPDVSQSHIVFTYANDLWLVPKSGGSAQKVASPHGQVMLPRFSPDGNTIAFVGNYEGGRDLYTLPIDGTNPIETAMRLTYHPSTELLSDWTPDGQSLLFSSNGYTGMRRAPEMFLVSQHGGAPEKLAISYGSAGALSPDGEWIAYTPENRDMRTWKRYRGGLASDIWLFNLKTNESIRMTDFEGTDTQPMWSPDGKAIYYLSDAGPSHRLNIWKYNVATQQHSQMTNYSDYDVKFPSIGPGSYGGGEIVFQVGSDLVLYNLASNQTQVVNVVIPTDRPTLRAKMVDFSEYISDGEISPTGKQAVVEARGDIWTIPAESDKGITRNLTRTSGVAERDPLWSPDGRWIAYLSDESGEYEIYLMQSDGKGETRKLTSDNDGWRYMQTFTPDSKHIVYSDKAGNVFLLEIESGETKKMFTDVWAQTPSISISGDSAWIATSLMLETGTSAIYLYNIEEDALHQVTEGFFNAKSPVFDRNGKFLYYVASMNFTPEYSAIDSTFIYSDSDSILAVPLNAEVENPALMELDEETWEDEEADEEEDEEVADSEEQEEDADEDEEVSDSEEQEEDADEEDSESEEDSNWDTEHPLFGKWNGTISGFAALGLPEDEISIELIFFVDHEGTISGTVEVMGETDDMDGEMTFDVATGEFSSTSTESGITSIMKGVVDGDSFEGTWQMVEMGISGTWVASRTSRDLSEEDAPSDNESDEPVVIDLEGFQNRAILLPIKPGTYSALTVNHKNQLLFMSMGGGMPSIKLYDISEFKDGVKNVIAGIGGYFISGDGKKLLVQGPGGGAIVKAASGQSLAKPLDTSSMDSKINPREEWSQLLRDAWRIQRDFFYDPNMHGVDWEDMYVRYAKMLPDCTTREDVSYLIGELIAELNVGHAYYGGGDEEESPNASVGMLGADFALDEDANGDVAYKITKIFEGATWEADARGPLSMPGLEVEEGDYLLAVNGLEIDADVDVYAALSGTIGKTTVLTVSDIATFGGEHEREIVVKPLRSEYNLRYRNWIETNRKYVAQMTDGKVGYIYVPNTGMDGQNDLFRQFYGQIAKEGIIIDERWNGGGQIPNRFIELLNRPRTNYWARRDGKDWPWPHDSHQGAKVMLINGAAGSGGDMFPWLFREAGLGKIIGTRTWGGLVGISGNPGLIDGGYTSVPTFGFYETDGTWGIEGHGVEPDIEVIDDPALMVEDGNPLTPDDPQLDEAIRVVLEEIKSNPYVEPSRPAYPDRSGMGITDEDK